MMPAKSDWPVKRISFHDDFDDCENFYHDRNGHF